MSEDEILHYGVKRRSGRYPWGSGKEGHERDGILGRVYDLRDQGKNEKDIAKELGMNTSQLRSAIALANEHEKQSVMDTISSMKSDGFSNTDIAKKTGLAESTIRYNLSKKDSVKRNQINKTAESLKSSIEDTPYLDIGSGVELQMGISRQKLKAAVEDLKSKGYYEHEIYVPQIGNEGKWTTTKVLTKEPSLDVVKQHRSEIKSPEQWSEDGGLTFQGLKPIKSVSRSRVAIKYGDKGGVDRDGLIQMRRGVKDLDLGDNHYAQVRIAVDGKNYLKGMAMYSDDLPKGVDLVFNTNKPSGTPLEKVLKPLKAPIDKPAEAFGATINRQKGALNIVNEEGDWAGWSGNKFSSQFLSKQPLALVRNRLSATYSGLSKEYDSISQLTNPIVKKFMLDEFASDLESKARHLKVLGLPRTKAHVLLPFPDMKPNEVYAPNYNNGEKVVLIRYPHGGTFEIPELTVNNKYAEAKKAIANSADAIGIHPSVAHKLSGADFDGDAVYVIPNNKNQIKATSSLKGLENFDPNSYSVGHPTITPKQKQTMMGEVSNLITDMTIKGASTSELTRAVRHSMVVIDSEKHQLDWKQSAIDNGIPALRKKYQIRPSVKYDPVTKSVKYGKSLVGASTLISRSKSSLETSSQSVEIKDPVTGKTRTVKRKITKEPLMDLITDAHALSSGTSVENSYADYINKLKALENTARKESMHISNIKKDTEASKLYLNEVKSLETKLVISKSNAPRERRAQILANSYYQQNATKDMTADQKKKLKSRALAYGRSTAKAQRVTIDITPKEWEAIQAHALSNNKLTEIIRNADSDLVKKYATPKPETKLTDAKLSKAQSLLDRGYTYAQVAESLGVSTSTLYNAVGK